MFFLGGSVEFPNLSFSSELMDSTSPQFRLQAQALNHYVSGMVDTFTTAPLPPRDPQNDAALILTTCNRLVASFMLSFQNTASLHPLLFTFAFLFILPPLYQPGPPLPEEDLSLPSPRCPPPHFFSTHHFSVPLSVSLWWC